MITKQLRRIVDAHSKQTGMPSKYISICPECGAIDDEDENDHVEVYDWDEMGPGWQIGCCGHCDFTGVWGRPDSHGTDWQRHLHPEVGQKVMF